MSVLHFGLTPKMKPVSPRRSTVAAALDVGTDKIVCLIARLKPQSPQEVLRRRSHGVEVFGFGHRDIDLFDQTCLALHTDPDGGQFLLIVEHERHMLSPGFDHLGFLLDSAAEVDAKLEACRAWQARDPRGQIKLYDDLELPDTVTHAFYVRYGLPIWIDVQHIAFRPGKQLEALDEIPPERIQIGACGVAIQRPLEMHHHQAPAQEYQLRNPLLGARWLGN